MLLLRWQFFTIRSLSPPGVVPSCSTVDSREGGDILRHIPPRLCSLHPLVFFFSLFIYEAHIAALSRSITVNDFRGVHMLRRDSGAQISLILRKRHCVLLPDHIRARVRSHTLVT